MVMLEALVDLTRNDPEAWSYGWGTPYGLMEDVKLPGEILVLTAVNCHPIPVVTSYTNNCNVYSSYQLLV